MSDEKNKMIPYFHKLSKLAADVENGVKEVQNKISLPKSDLPENSALIASVQVLDSVVVLKKEINSTEEELDRIEHSRQSFIDNFQKDVKDTERKIDELENVLKKYGYVPWEPPRPDLEENTDQDKSNSENGTTEENVASQATEELSTANVDQVKISDKKRSCTPECSVRSLTYILRNSRKKHQNDGPSKYNANYFTPQRRPSFCTSQPTNQLQTPVCFSDNIVCTPGLFIPFQKKCLRNGTLMNPNFCEPSLFTPNRHVREIENVYTNVQSPQFPEEDVTVELFKKVTLKSSYINQRQKESITPEEPALQTQHIIQEIQKSTIMKKSKKEKSITPEDPVLHSQHLLEEIRKSTKKNATTRHPIFNEKSSTPESPKLKSLEYLRKSTIYKSLLR